MRQPCGLQRFADVGKTSLYGRFCRSPPGKDKIGLCVPDGLPWFPVLSFQQKQNSRSVCRGFPAFLLLCKNHPEISESLKRGILFGDFGGLYTREKHGFLLILTCWRWQRIQEGPLAVCLWLLACKLILQDSFFTCSDKIPLPCKKELPLLRPILPRDGFQIFRG